MREETVSHEDAQQSRSLRDPRTAFCIMMQSEDEYKTSIRKCLNRIIQNLTDEGNLDYDGHVFQSLVAEVAKKEQQDTELIIEVFLEIIKRSGCPDRILLLQLVDFFFLGYPIFRNILLNDPNELLELILETDPIRNQLPGSKKNANKLKSEAIRVVKGWEKAFAKSDARMKCIVVTLKKTKFVDYENGDLLHEKEKKRKELIAKRKRKMLETALTAYKNKFEEIKKVADKLFIELDSTLELLVPSFTDDIDASQPSTSAPKNHEHLVIILKDLAPEIVVSPENDAIVEAMIDAKTLLVHRIQTLRKLVKRIQLLKKDGEELAQTVIDYREGLKKLVFKAEELKITGRKRGKSEKKRFDDDFIDVEISIDDILMIQYSKQAEEAIEKEKQQKEEVKQKEDKIVKKKEAIKSVPFGLDLKYWGEERKDVQVPKNNADCHRFWRASEDETISGTVQESIYTQRQYTFIGEAPKSDKVCRAKLANGALCPRRDFHSCPLHGTIVDRDDKGDPISESDRRLVTQREEKKRRKEAEEFSKKIEKEYEKKTKRKKKHDVETTDSEDVRNRLQQKLFDPKTIERVSAVLDASMKNRLQRNFGHQFSHM